MKIGPNAVKLGIDAPVGINIVREELVHGYKVIPAEAACDVGDICEDYDEFGEGI